MGLARIFGICSAFLFAASVGAAEIIDLGPSDYRRWGTGTNTHTMEGLRSSTGQTVRMPPLNSTLNVTRNAVIPYGSIANGMRIFTRINPVSAGASAAVTGLFLAMDWYFDQELGEWVKEDVESVPPLSGSWIAVGGSTTLCSNAQDGMEFDSPSAACSHIASCYTPPRTVTDITINSTGSSASCLMNPPGSRAISSSITCDSNSSYDVSVGLCVATVPAPLDGSDFQELASYLPSASPGEVGSAGNDVIERQGAPLPGYSDSTITGPSSFTGPQTTSTSTDPVTGDTTVTNTSTQTNISYGDTTITTTTTTTTTTYQNGQETSTTETTETPGELPVAPDGGAALGDWPAFCDWATVVCDWLNWTQEDPPPEQDLPQVIDEDFFEQKRISFGSKSCPPDHEINLAPFLETTVGVSFQPLCDFAGLIYYMVMMASYIIAAYISIGVARNA